MRLLRLLTLRSLRARPLRVLLSMAGIVLGVAGMLAISITNQAALRSVTDLLQDASGKANLVITAAETGSNGMPESILQTVLTTRGVAYVAPVLRMQTTLATADVPEEVGLSFFGAEVGGLLLYGVDPLSESAVRSYTVSAGRLLSPDSGASEIVLVDTFAADEGISMMKWVQIITPSGPARLRVVGLIAKEGPGRLNNGAFGLIPLRTAQKLFGREGRIDQIDVVAQAEPGKGAQQRDVDALRYTLSSRLGESYAVLYPASQGERMTQMLSSYQIGLNFLSGIALFVGAFLIYNAFAMTVVERTREFGMLRTLGMTRRQVTIQVLAEAAMLGTSGSGIGLGLGVLLSRGLARLMELLLNQPVATIDAPQGALIVPFLLGLGVTVIAAALPALQAGKVSPLEALRVRGQSGAGWLSRHGWKMGIPMLLISTVILVRNPFPYDVQFRLGSMTVFLLFTGATLMIPQVVVVWERGVRPLLRIGFGSSGSLGSRNIQRAQIRTTLTVAALMIGISMILVVRGMTGSFAADLRIWMASYIGGDIYVSSSIPMRPEIGRRLSAVEGVGIAAPVRYFEVEWLRSNGTSERLTFMAVDPDTYTRVTQFVFSSEQVAPDEALRRFAEDNALFVSSVIAEKYGIRPNDVITLRTRLGLRPFTIAGVVVDFFNQGLVIDGSWDTMRRYFRIDDATTYLVNVAPGYGPAAVEAEIERLYGDRYRLIVESNAAIRDRAFSLMDQAFRMFDVLALIAVAVGSLGVVNTLTMNVVERTQEIGMLRSVGMTRPQVVGMILAEASVMGLLGGLLGLTFGVTLTRIFLLGMTAMSGYKLSLEMPFEGVVVAFAVGLVISQAAALLPAIRAARVEILRAIHYE